MGDSDSSDVVEGTPEKEHANRTIVGNSLICSNKEPRALGKKIENMSSLRESLECISKNSDMVAKNSVCSQNNSESEDSLVLKKCKDQNRVLASDESDVNSSVDSGVVKSVHPSKTPEKQNYREAKKLVCSSESDESDSQEEEDQEQEDEREGNELKVTPVLKSLSRKPCRIVLSDSESSAEEQQVPQMNKYRKVHQIISSDSESNENEADDKITISSSSSNENVSLTKEIISIDSTSPEKSTAKNSPGNMEEKTITNNSFHENTSVNNIFKDNNSIKNNDGPTKNKSLNLSKENTAMINKPFGNDSSVQIIHEETQMLNAARTIPKKVTPVKIIPTSTRETERMSFAPTESSTPVRTSDIIESSQTDVICDLGLSFDAIAISQKKTPPTLSGKKSPPNKLEKKNFPEKSSLDLQDLAMKKKLMQSQISILCNEIGKLKMILRTANLDSLADHGTRLQLALGNKQVELKKLREQWNSLNLDSVSVETTTTTTLGIVPKSNINIEKPVPHLPIGSSGAVPKKGGYLGSMPSTAGMGKKAFETHMGEKAMTVDTLKHLHGALKSCPGEDIFAEDPKALRSSVQLMQHQKRALAWLMWRENNKPYGGILADDMGLGKTLTMISLVLKSKEELENKDNEDADSEDDDSDNSLHSRRKNYEKGGTLVVCPASLINQWEGEIKKRVKKGVLDVEVYHGSSRESRPRRLARRDIVITTYNIVRSEGGVIALKSGSSVDRSKQGTIFGVKWERIILDEAHTIRNNKSQTSISASSLKAKHRWALTGTPVHNKELDLYSLLKFLRCSPFDDLIVWRRWIDNKSAGGLQRLNTVINSLMLRRTKEQLQNAGDLSCLPTKDVYEIYVKLDKEEFEVYQTILNFSRTLFAQFLAQKVEKEQMFEVKFGQSNQPTYMQGEKATFPHEMNDELRALHQKMKSMGDVKSFHILVLLLRLRQVCCHPALIENMLDAEACKNDGIEDETGLDVDLLSQLKNMDLEDKPKSGTVDADGEVKKRILVSSNPVFNKERISSKMRALFKELEKVISKGDSAVIVSQFKTLLDLVKQHLRDFDVKCLVLTGSVPVKERMSLVDEFNSSSGSSKVLLLSLTAGGVGLNLIGGNHLLLLDPHWNPQLEAQAFDRIYRVGQKKSVHIYKFYSEETIEQQIKKLQTQKLTLASSVLTGSKHHQVNKLSMDDLKMLFNFNHAKN